MFNDARSTSGEKENVYKVLEDNKDIWATGSKYDNDNIVFKMPNMVMIFSNHYPRISPLSKDRWAIYNANQAGLDVTEKIIKIRKN